MERNQDQEKWVDAFKEASQQMFHNTDAFVKLISFLN